MNIENDFLTDFDLFGKNPEFYYKGKSKKSSIFGIVLTVIYILLYISFLIYKLVRMFKRVDLTFYDSYTFKGIPSINLTNNEFYGGFGMGGIVDERMYYLEVDYVSNVRVNGQFVESRTRLETEICKLEWFGPDYQEIFADQLLDNYYCIKDVSGMVLEGYSNLDRYSYFNVRFYPCVGKTKKGEDCYDDLTKMQFFTINKIELKIQDNDLNPEDYKNPVTRREVSMNSPVFLDLFQLIYSYLQIVNIETDEDLTGLNFFSDTIRRQQYTRYDESFLIASPLLYGQILQTGGPIADVTLQLAAKVLTEKRQYMQLIDVLGDVGGLMEILYTFLNIISSFVTEILYDKSLVNNLFSFDLNKKYVVFNRANIRKRIMNEEDHKINDLYQIEPNHLKSKLEDMENNRNIEFHSKDNSNEQNTIISNSVSLVKKRTKNKKSSKNSNSRYSKANLVQVNEQQNNQNEEAQNNGDIISLEDNNNVINNNKVDYSERLGTPAHSHDSANLKNVYINNCLICCFWCTRRKNNMNRILFEEGSKIITKRLDILNMFNHLYTIELIQKKLGIENEGINMSNRCKKNLKIYYNNNPIKTE